MTRVIELLMAWTASAPHREWRIQSDASAQKTLYVELTEGVRHIRKYFTEEIVKTAQIDVLQMETAAMIELLAYGRHGSESPQ